MSYISGLQKFNTISAGLVTAALGILILGFAYGSQHLFGFEPCTMCIEIRFWISIAVIVSLISSGLSMFSKWGARMTQLVSAAFFAAGTVEAMRLTLIESGKIFSGCTPFTFYQDYLPLHTWWEGMYAVQGLCGEAVPLVGGLSYSNASVLVLCTISVFAFLRFIRMFAR
jgi:disulfide bond formation protein DsbB